MPSLLPPIVRLLDSRPRDVAVKNPLRDSLNIPFEELADRLNELPPRSRVLHVAETGPQSQSVVDWLSAHGRPAELYPSEPGPRSCGRLWEANSFLEEVVTELVPGSVLDFACGGGRNPVFLASMGWRVLAVDHLATSIHKAADLERRYTTAGMPPVQWCIGDVLSLHPQPRFDLLTMFFFLDRELIAQLPSFLKPGGSVLIETFTEENRRRFGKPSYRFLLKSGELPAMLPELQVHRYEEGLHNGRFTARLWASVP